MALEMKEKQSEVLYAFDILENPELFKQLTEEELAIGLRKAESFGVEAERFYRSANFFILIMYFQWMFVFQ